MDKPNKREWGFLFFDNNNFSRHIGFDRVDQLSDFCKRLGPSDCYHSAAYYNNPVASTMDDKGWGGCDLIFDVDADHLETSCKKEHDLWICDNCKSEGRGEPPEKCLKCGASNISKITWICHNCLEAAKKEIINVLDDFLLTDLGLDYSQIFLVFSGHRGYHIHVEDDKIKKLDSNARKEIIDYIRGNGVSPDFLGLTRTPGKVIIGPKSEDYGWRGRINKYIIRLLGEVSEDKLREIGFIKSKRDAIINNLSMIIDNLSLKEDNIPGFKGISWDFAKLKIGDWLKLIEYSIKRYGGKIDEPVTADIHRLIRTPNSLNGKTGFKTQILNRDQIEQFDPLKDPVVFNGYIKVKIHRAPRIVLNDESYGPFYDEVAELPMNVGVFLACKNVAEVL